MSNAVMPLGDYVNVCNKIREKTESTDTIKSGQLADKVNEVYKKGRQSWWDAFQQQGTGTMYAYAFYGNMWTDDIYEPIYPFIVSNGYGMYHGSYITDVKLPIEFSNTSVQNQNMFNTTRIITIPLLKVTENNTFASNMFTNATGLKNITFDGVIANSLTMGTCAKLSKASIQSIFDCLSSTASGVTLTLSTTAVNNAFSGGSTGTEWLNLVSTKPNWTISLSN